MQGVWIGTSGWVYKHWAESFYPSQLRKADEFQFYASHFPTVEINTTFYRLPTQSMVSGWNERAPEQFLFAVKGSRFITHMKKLIEPKAALRKYFDRIRPLKEHTGPFLWQLPAQFQFKPELLERLGVFLRAVPGKHRHAIEFRHPSWIQPRVFDVLRQFGTANVWLSSSQMPMDFTETADFVYLRFHGLAGGAAHDYTEAELKPWASQLRRVARAGKAAFVYFNNDWNTRAPLNAKMLMELTGKFAVQPFGKPDARMSRLRAAEPRQQGRLRRKELPPAKEGSAPLGRRHTARSVGRPAAAEPRSRRLRQIKPRERKQGAQSRR